MHGIRIRGHHSSGQSNRGMKKSLHYFSFSRARGRLHGGLAPDPFAEDEDEENEDGVEGAFPEGYYMDEDEDAAGTAAERDLDPRAPANDYYPVFNLAMISLVGRPLRAITNRSGFFDNVNFSLHWWQAPY
ncbi:hypothetical protein TOPH_07873 [Tolypocladium ophioglossoides CBS 100239]|uniref:Uncharacterized protein n=1 Tax=Tolypocladium ophioglossoides (strain CBS 100239) TaxID=1163406 RepID=A0A0L0N048_TOLOC|nr:hypothetical protein TOPH_07873 [Tolypocladium ophioglossoides CBS 100239]